MYIDFLLDVFRENSPQDAIIWNDKSYTYGWLIEAVDAALQELEDSHLIQPGHVVGLDADYSPKAIAMFLALIEKQCVIVPVTGGFRSKKPEFWEIAQLHSEVIIDPQDHVAIKEVGYQVTHDVTQALTDKKEPGLVIFSSGSTGASKAAVHSCVRLLEKYKTRRNATRTIPFMLFDHIGGINTMLHILSCAGAIVVVNDRSAESVCRAVQDHKVEVLPTSPTFINLLLLSETYKKYDLSSLKVLAYGAEAMPESTLKRIHAAMPDVELVQNYGASEIGIMRSKSESSDSLWVKIGGEGYETRVRDGMLEVKAQSAMLGYLNAPSPFTEDGWFKTGDMVEVKGDYVRILGRASDLINVGGEKVYPAEVEGIISQMDGVLDVAVTGEPHAITGRMVKATVRLSTDEKKGEFRKRMATFLAGKLPDYKIPQKVAITDQEMTGARLKKMRKDL